MSGDMHHKTVIIDNGSHRIRAGLAGDDAPNIVFPDIVGRPTSGSGGEFVGKNAQAKLDVLSTKSPIEKGLITNWDDMEKIWTYAYTEELKKDPSELPLLITEHPGTPKENKEKMAQILFEKLKVPGVFMANQAVLSLYAAGRKSGLVISSGEEVTHIVPVFSGYAIPDSVMSMDIGGKHVTNCLRDMLNSKGQTFSSSSSDMDVVRQIKEAVCYVAPDLAAETKKSEADITKTYKLPDGKELKVTREAYESAEIMYNPSKCGQSGPGLLDIVQQCVSKCDMDIRHTLYENLVLAGGNTSLGTFSDRLKNGLSSAVKTSSVKVVAPKMRDHSAWIGGSILAALDEFKDLPVTRKEYEENGVQAIHKKF